ncbi:hypothetical protein NFI96_032629, partial [Prochilodus magdalenae]
MKHLKISKINNIIFSVSSLALHEGRVRLSGGRKCNGEVEVYFRQDWRRVLLDSGSGPVALCGLQTAGLWLCVQLLQLLSHPVPETQPHVCDGFQLVLGVKLIWGTAAVHKRSTAAPENSCTSPAQLTAPSGWLVLEETVQEGWRFSTAVHGGT